jgi:hypothetical protein
MTKQYTVHVMEVVKKKKKKTPTAIFSYDCMMIMSSLHNYNTGIMMLIRIHNYNTGIMMLIGIHYCH